MTAMDVLMSAPVVIAAWCSVPRPVGQSLDHPEMSAKCCPDSVKRSGFVKHCRSMLSNLTALDVRSLLSFTSLL